MTRSRLLPTCLAIGAISLIVQLDADAVNAPSCPATQPTTEYAAGVLTGDCSSTSTSSLCTIKAGTTANGTNIELQKAGSTFKSTPITTPGTIIYATAADFNKDGFVDFAGASETTAADYLQIFRNYTWQSENCTDASCTSYTAAGAPNWASTSYVATPKFTAGTDLHTKYITATTAVTYSGRYSLAAADFNGDGWPDIFEGYASTTGSYSLDTLNMYLNKGVNDASGNAQWLARYSAAASTFTPSSVLGAQLWSSSNTQALDYNHDGKMDILVATSAGNGSIRILLNNCPGSMQANGVFLCSSNPKFIDGGDLITGLATIGGTADGFGSSAGSTATFYYIDFDGGGVRDLVVAAPNCCTSASRRLRLFKGCTTGATCVNGLDTGAPQAITFAGGATDVIVADFSLDGKPDLVAATDNFNYNAGNGATTTYYVNNGTATPFSGGIAQTLTTTGSATIGGATDFDLGLVFDYDSDPAHTPDMLLADGNNSARYYILADRVSTTYVSCGDVTSGLIDLGTVASADAIVTSSRLSPHVTSNAAYTYTYSVTNNADATSPNWMTASTCAAPLSPASGVTDYCATFTTVGNKVRWKAHMCTSDNTQTPQLSDMGFRFDYTAASEFYKSGVTVFDGAAYVGAIRQPGDRGKMYALDAALTRGGTVGQTAPYWEVGSKLDNTMTDGQRNIFTSSGATQIAFSTASASNATLRSLLGLSSDTTPFTATSELIKFVRGESTVATGMGRFGYGTATSPLTKLGSVLTSSAAILSAPGLPSWYTYAGSGERSTVDAFVSANTGRIPLVMFGSKDGMLHAIYSITSGGNSDSRNGTEAWAYIPPTVASGLFTDEQATITANAAATDGVNHRKATHYPDGSPTLFDYYTGSGMKTVALIAEGNGGRDFTVLDVTSSVTTGGTVNGPTPMWNNSAIDSVANPGYAFAKPLALRIKSGGLEKFIVVAGSGVDDYPTPAAKGRVVAGYDLATGTVQWKFHLKCPLSSELTAFETDDTLESGSPAIDGYADRVVFADTCGYVYKIDPAAVTNGGWTTGLGSIAANVTADGDSTSEVALWKTASSTLGVDRPIAGTIGVRIDNTGRLVLYFGTGGLEAVATTLTNAFFAVYADNGALRSQYTGTCGSSGCEKFYGGVVVSPTQVLFTRSIDPVSGVTNPVTGCADDGSATVEAYELNKTSTTAFTSDFTQAVSSAITGALYGEAGAIYFATISGEVTRIGTPRASNAGDDSAAGHTQGNGTGQNGAGTSGASSALTLVGWRVAL